MAEQLYKIRNFYTERIDSNINTFAKKIIKFCKEKNIQPSLKTFLEYKTEKVQFVPDCYSYFVGGGFPKEYFCNSKKFFNFWKSLPLDFRNDIISQEELVKYRRMILADSKLHEFVKDKLKKDYVY